MAESQNHESRLLAALLEMCSWLEKLDYPMSRLRGLIAESGAVAAAKQALSSANWWDGLVELFARGETRRSLEALVLSQEFCSLFTEQERAVAQARLEDCQAGLQTEGEEILGSATPGQHTLSSGSPTTVDPCRYNNLDPHERIEQQERDLRSGLPLTATSWDRMHVEQCPVCAQEHPMVVKAYHEFDSDTVNKLEDLLEVLKVCLDYSDNKVKLLLEQMWLLPEQAEKSDWWKINGEDTDEGMFLDLCNDAENDLPPLLEYRAATVAAHVGDFISTYASTVSRKRDGDQLIQWRESVGPGVVADFVRHLDQDQFLRLLIADQCYRVNSGYSRVEILTVWSNGEMPPVEGVLAIKPFPPPTEWGRCARSFDFGYFMDWVLSGAILRNPECKEAPRLQLEMRTAPTATAGDQASRARKHKKLSHEDRRNQLEESLREAMSEKAYSGLILEARPSALQAEYLWLHADCPEPSDVVFSLARAFEIQLRNGWLKGLADHLLAKGVREYPKDSGYKTLLFNGKFRGEHLPLGEMEKVVGIKCPHLDEYCAECGSELQKVRAALRRVIDFRNTAAHKGCLSLELVRQIRGDWLGQTRPGEGIFQALISSASSRT